VDWRCLQAFLITHMNISLLLISAIYFHSTADAQQCMWRFAGWALHEVSVNEGKADCVVRLLPKLRVKQRFGLHTCKSMLC
jgi:hypothetical protein